ncbi:MULTISPECIES: hypothetical protein [unclassified Streptomyces]|uniref:hypothetical protein n=1 Tax=unclassified Streptomyces TaxID=2593676 RepID=UPI001F033DDF|nr:MULTISPECIES: hypothetical protein [unclassified Streptomyces]MCH0563344.1 hypothetical protein [Streptomyces sp. MUM 2J]MCH0572553.1 hypothetical protein [Streptomyces sp. MUM 136J]
MPATDSTPPPHRPHPVAGPSMQDLLAACAAADAVSRPPRDADARQPREAAGRQPRETAPHRTGRTGRQRRVA